MAAPIVLNAAPHGKCWNYELKQDTQLWWQSNGLRVKMNFIRTLKNSFVIGEQACNFDADKWPCAEMASVYLHGYASNFLQFVWGKETELSLDCVQRGRWPEILWCFWWNAWGESRISVSSIFISGVSILSLLLCAPNSWGYQRKSNRTADLQSETITPLYFPWKEPIKFSPPPTMLIWF